MATDAPLIADPIPAVSAPLELVAAAPAKAETRTTIPALEVADVPANAAAEPGASTPTAVAPENPDSPTETAWADVMVPAADDALMPTSATVMPFDGVTVPAELDDETPLSGTEFPYPRAPVDAVADNPDGAPLSACAEINVPAAVDAA